VDAIDNHHSIYGRAALFLALKYLLQKKCERGNTNNERLISRVFGWVGNSFLS